MNNEELKKKICEIIAPYVSAWGEDERIADALIAAGIGDVKEAEAEANRYEMLYKMQSRDMALAERKAYESEHRAEVAEKSLYCLARSFAEAMCKDGDTQHITDGFINDAYKQAEKELAEERKDD